MSKGGVMNLADRLSRPKESAEKSADLQIPSAPCSLRVNIDQLIPYDGNPRQSVNPLYEEIKDSIRARGLDHAPNITARPGASAYMIKDGGNTRLQILRELWKETQNPKFYEFECKFHPWVGELDTLAGHMVENELHGSMMFIDRALAATRMRGLILDETGEESISSRKLAKAISDTGWSTNAGNLTVMLYAAEQLLPFLPEALWGGLGRDSVKRIRKLQDCAAQYAEHLGIDKQRFEDLWAFALQESDADNFAHSDLFAAISHQLRQEKQIDGIGLVEAELDALLQGGTLSADQAPDSSPPATGLSISGASQPMVPSSPKSPNAGGEVKNNPAFTGFDDDHYLSETGNPSALPQEPVRTAEPQVGAPAKDLDTLRHEIRDRALWVATNTEIISFIAPISEGTGYEVQLSSSYTSSTDYIDIQAGFIALLAQMRSSCLDYNSDQINDLPSRLCQVLFQGDWQRMSSTLYQVTHIMRNDPEIVADGLYRLYEIEALIYELNQVLQTKRHS